MSTKTGVKYLDFRYKRDGSIYYFYNPDKKAQRAGVVQAKGLGPDFETAKAYALDKNRLLDEWRKTGKGAPSPFHSASWPRGSVGELCQAFMNSRLYTKRIREDTRRGYASAIKRFVEFEYKGRLLGTVDANQLRHRHLEEIYEQFLNTYDSNKRAYKGGVTTTNYMIRVLKRVFEFGITREYVSSNPFRKLGLEREERRTQRWTYDHILTFVSTAEAEGRPSIGLAVMLGYELGQRVHDILYLTWDQFDGEVFKGEQSKTSNEWWVPVSEELKQKLNSISVKHGYIIINEKTGKPYMKGNASQVFRKIKTKAGLPNDLLMMDLRRTVATELGESGATEDEIMSQTGHKSRQAVRHYVNPGRVMSQNAAQKRWANRGKETHEGQG